MPVVLENGAPFGNRSTVVFGLGIERQIFITSNRNSTPRQEIARAA